MEAGDWWLWLVYVSPFVLVLGLFRLHRSRRQRLALATLQQSREAGLTEAMSLHPVIDPVRCIGSGCCVTACPEGDVIGMINGKATLIDPSRCIGHGACKAACPHDAIELVFGSARRGVDIPAVDEHFGTNVAGIYIAGELGGMGLVRNAVIQGCEAVESIARLPGMKSTDLLDLVIVGAGPAGMAAALKARQLGLSYRVLEQEGPGGAIAHFPRGKVVMTAPVELPLVGAIRFTEVAKEELVRFWDGVIREHQLDIQCDCKVTDIQRDGSGFRISSSQGEVRCRAVLLAIGRRGSPRKLGVPGEELPKVIYRLIDAEQYRNSRVLVVGGGDSALEAAASIAGQPGTEVTLSYRGEAFSRARGANRERVAAAVATGRLTVLMNSDVTRIDADRVELQQQGQRLSLANDHVLVAAGGILPTAFLQQIGIQVNTHYGTR